MQLTIWTGIIVLLSTQLGISKSGEITEEFIKKFAEGIEEFKRASQENIFQDGTFDPSKYNEDAAFRDAEKYDFIIVGAGAAGSVIASRLSEVPQWKILLLEAGETESIYTQVPSHSGFLQGSKYNWGYLTEAQETWCLGNIDQKCTAPTGKGLGGATVIHGLIYTRGNAHDYNLWASQGNAGWSYHDVLPYFKKAEDCALKEYDSAYHGKEGPMYVEESQYQAPLRDTFLEAGRELGYKILDYNGKEQIGFSKTQATTKHGKRNSAAHAYLYPYQTRKNLHIKPLSQVIQILIGPTTREAYGVKFIRNNTMYIAKASREVIVSAGPFNSPQLLMLSGIGPRTDLNKLQIPVIKDLPVGKLLRDHAGFQGATFILTNATKFDEPSAHEQLKAWVKEGKGPLSTAGAQALAFINTNIDPHPTPDYPDVELVLSRAGYASNLRIRKEYRSVLEPSGNYNSFRIGVMPLHPKSTGSVKLKSKDPFKGPRITSNFFSDPHDIATMIAGIKKAIEITQTRPFKKLGAQLYSKPVEECKMFEFATDDYWKCAVRYLSISFRHQTGTCKMGRYEDKDTVVDNKLCVHGIHRLRVADSSVIPVPISGHTHAASNMIGEKASDLIKMFWRSIPRI